MTAAPSQLRMARAALAELFLDTELDDGDFQRLCDMLVKSGLSVDELERIYADEVAPVLHRNLKAVAGEWSGFDMDWLEGEIAKNAARPQRAGSMLARVRRRWVLRETGKDWQRLRTLIEARVKER